MFKTIFSASFLWSCFQTIISQFNFCLLNVLKSWFWDFNKKYNFWLSNLIHKCKKFFFEYMTFVLTFLKKNKITTSILYIQIAKCKNVCFKKMTQFKFRVKYSSIKYVIKAFFAWNAAMCNKTTSSQIKSINFAWILTCQFIFVVCKTRIIFKFSNKQTWCVAFQSFWSANFTLFSCLINHVIISTWSFVKNQHEKNHVLFKTIVKIQFNFEKHIRSMF